MIYTNLDNLHRYQGLCPALDTAIRRLDGLDLSTLTPGRNEVDGDTVVINRLDYTTIPESEAAWEGHARYGDIHIMISGEERIGVSQSGELKQTVYNLGFEGPVSAWFSMGKGAVLIVFPEDIHMVKVQKDCPIPVSRAVVKFKVG